MIRKVKSYLIKKFPKFMQKKLVLLYGVIILAFVVLVGRVTYINARSGDEYTRVVLEQQQYDSQTIPYKRGDITDRNGTKLATSERVYNVILDVKALKSDDAYESPTIAALVDCFDLKESDIQKVIEDNPDSRYQILKKGVEYATAQKFEKLTADTENNSNIKGVWHHFV